MPRTPKKGDKIAFVLSQRIGDTLISMVLIQNLVKHGFDVTLYSTHLTALLDWFPGFKIFPAIKTEHARKELEKFDIVIHAYAKDAVGDTLLWHPEAWVMNDWPIYLTLKPMIEIQLDVCREIFGITDVSDYNGIVLPAYADSEIARNRVVIHPTASELEKQWLPLRFLRLATLLRDRGHAVCFVVAPDEREAWSWVEPKGFTLVTLASLSQLASWLVPAGLLIGNDSGIAHLASNVGVPTISLAKRRRIALRWKPGWAPSLALTPLSIVPGARPREALWKYLLPVSKVMRAVDTLTRMVSGTPRAFGVGSNLGRSSGAVRIPTALIDAPSDLQACSTVPTNDANASIIAIELATGAPLQPAISGAGRGD